MAKPPKNMDERGRIWKGVNPHTGTRTAVYHSDSAGLDSSGGAKYSVVCEDHGNIISVNSAKSGISAAKTAQDWCEDCRTAQETGRLDNFEKGANNL